VGDKLKNKDNKDNEIIPEKYIPNSFKKFFKEENLDIKSQKRITLNYYRLLAYGKKILKEELIGYNFYPKNDNIYFFVKYEYTEILIVNRGCTSYFLLPHNNNARDLHYYVHIVEGGALLTDLSKFKNITVDVANSLHHNPEDYLITPNQLSKN
jgi:hypothetical protein